jgi:hypothetical protein
MRDRVCFGFLTEIVIDLVDRLKVVFRLVRWRWGLEGTTRRISAQGFACPEAVLVLQARTTKLNPGRGYTRCSTRTSI